MDVERSSTRVFGLTPIFSFGCGFHIYGDGREHRQSDCENEGDAERHHPDLKTRTWIYLFSILIFVYNELI